MVFLSQQLEDIAISPSSFNPSLNSVECVADGGYENHLKNINKAFPQICWLILFSSLIGSNLIRMLVLKYCRGESSRAKSILSLVFVVLLCGTIVAIVAVIYSRQAQIIYPLTYLLFILSIFLLCSAYYLFQAGNEDNKIWKWRKTTFGKYITLDDISRNFYSRSSRPMGDDRYYYWALLGPASGNIIHHVCIFILCFVCALFLAEVSQKVGYFGEN